LSVHPDHWDFQNNRPLPKCPNRELILKTILEKEAKFQREILELISMQKEYTASSLIAAKTNQVKIKTVEEFFNKLIENFKKTDNEKSVIFDVCNRKRSDTLCFFHLKEQIIMVGKYSRPTLLLCNKLSKMR